MSGSFPLTPFPSKVIMRSRPRVFTDYTMSGKKFSRSFGVHVWELDITFPPMSRAEFDPIYAFILSQIGSYGTFTFAAHDRRTPRGSVSGSPSGTPLVNGASQTGTSLVTDGWPHSHTGLLLPGDLITINGDTKVYMVTASVDSNGSGQATISLHAPLVVSPADNAAITTVNIAFTVSISQDIQELSTAEADIYEYSLSLTEAL